MSFLDELAFGPGRDWRAWIRALLLFVALLALVAAILYVTVAGDYAFLRASVYTGAPTGAYHTVGERLAARALKKNGHLRVVVTAGSVENIKRLVGENGRCEPAFAFVQDGVPLPDDAGLQMLGRLPQPESLLLLARRGRAIASFEDLKGASVGIGPEGSGTGFLMQHLLDNTDLKDLGLRPSNHGLEAQAALVQANQLDLAAFVMNENAELIRNLVEKYDLEIVSPPGIDGLAARDRWLRLGKIPAGYYDVGRGIPATDKDVAQVDTLLITNACVGRAQRVAFLKLLSDEFPAFVRSNPPPAARSQDAAPLADEAREFFANGQPALPDRYFPRLVNLMSPAYWIYLAMAVTVLLNGLGGLQPLPALAHRRQPGAHGGPAQGARDAPPHARPDQGASGRGDSQLAAGPQGGAGPDEGPRGASRPLCGAARVVRDADGKRNVLSLPGVDDRGRDGGAFRPASTIARRWDGAF